MCKERFPDLDVKLHLTRLADSGRPHGWAPETNEDISAMLKLQAKDPATKIIFMNAALCDYRVTRVNSYGGVGKYAGRLKTSDGDVELTLTPAEKVIKSIRKERKDIFLVGFKTTCDVDQDEQYIAGLDLLKRASCNLVLANDTRTKLNMIITPEEARYHVTGDREEVLKQLVDMAYLRSHLTFTRSTVVDGTLVGWGDERVPPALRIIVNHCVDRGAYKPFNGATVGHFACKIDDTTFLTSIRKSNFNDIATKGLVLVKTDGPDTVLAYGARPSVGGQSQRLVFRDHPGMDCIVHFHCPLKKGSLVPARSQREYECGSHQCGQNTSDGLGQFGELKAVFLEEHGPNIVFNRNINPQVVIDFIEANFDLDGKTGGYVS